MVIGAQLSVAAASRKLGTAASRRFGGDAVGRVWLWLRIAVPLLALSSAIGVFGFAGSVVVAVPVASQRFGAVASRKCLSSPLARRCRNSIRQGAGWFSPVAGGLAFVQWKCFSVGAG